MVRLKEPSDILSVASQSTITVLAFTLRSYHVLEQLKWIYLLFLVSFHAIAVDHLAGVLLIVLFSYFHHEVLVVWLFPETYRGRG